MWFISVWIFTTRWLLNCSDYFHRADVAQLQGTSWCRPLSASSCHTLLALKWLVLQWRPLTCVPTILPHSLKGRKLCCVTYFCRSVQITGQPQMFLCPVYCRCRYENENYAWWKSSLITDIPLMFFKIKFMAGSSICDSSKFESVCRTFPRKFKSSFFKISSPRACTLKMWESFSERVLEDLVILRCTTFDACDCTVCSLRLLFLGRYHLKPLVLGLSEPERGGSNIFRNVTVYKSTCHCNPDTWLL